MYISHNIIYFKFEKQINYFYSEFPNFLHKKIFCPRPSKNTYLESTLDVQSKYLFIFYF